MTCSLLGANEVQKATNQEGAGGRGHPLQAHPGGYLGWEAEARFEGSDGFPGVPALPG